MRNNDDDDAASISLKDINLSRSDRDWDKVSSVTITDITNPYYRSLVGIHRAFHSSSMCSSVSDDETNCKSLKESLNFESLAGDESWLHESGRQFSGSKILESELYEELSYIPEQGEGSKWMPSWKKSILDALREYKIGEASNSDDEELLTSKLNNAINLGLKIVDREQKRLRRQSARISAMDEGRKSLITIDEGNDEQSQQTIEEIGQRMSRGLSILETDRSTLLAFKRELSFDGNNAEYFSWNNSDLQNSATSQTDADGGSARPRSRGMSLVEEARRSLLTEGAEFDISEPLEKDNEEGYTRSSSIFGSYKALLSFCVDTSLPDQDKAIFSSNMTQTLE